MQENLLEIAKQVILDYDIKPSVVELFQYGSIKTVWKLYDSSGLYCLKRMRYDIEKCLFSVNAQKYMLEKGANLPDIVDNIHGSSCTKYKGQTFVLYKWLAGRQLKFEKKRDLKLLVKGLARFHLASAGYTAGSEILISSKLGRWPHQYSSMRDRLIRWKETARGKSRNKLGRIYLEQADFFISLADKALELLEKSGYSQWVNELQLRKTLCHQDYGESNTLWTGKQLVVLDLDGVAYDLPVRDLRKLIFKVMLLRKGWHEDTWRKILTWYEAENPFTEEQRRILLIDLLFPHEFHNTAKNPFHKGKESSANKLALVSSWEQQKAAFLKKLL
ncbi:spore coat protein, CotS family [Desulfofarcimen acetoxidans DSM 771]|jgi:spore coat protein I|uniref:Spore coat protein, CotS family n=1 Tax=Desulfofarcimen acetoxidans (strain ATCC 49208 / DSM 771 / KCTC 5769 / VKM B-1644 / 5575) TaxID=485916 RepID=C8W4A8_DESAS|nr:CotS family spore coat protein [Desulfofarcimen acetoxidans]ACV61976.1 spore coat protein, CotS family [Desulfofarcimen acetoxidans DSM 771]